MGCGSSMRRADSSNRNTAEPVINVACASPDSASALPCPKRCSRSAGDRAWRTASRFTSEARASSMESIKVASRLTEPDIPHATSLATISTSATVIEAYVACRIRRPACCGEIAGDSAATFVISFWEPGRIANSSKFTLPPGAG